MLINTLSEIKLINIEISVETFRSIQFARK